MSKKIKVADLTVFDAANYLKNDQDCANYLSLALEGGDPALHAAALDQQLSVQPAAY